MNDFSSFIGFLSSFLMGLLFSYINSKKNRFNIYWYYFLLLPSFIFPINMFIKMLSGNIFYISILLPVLKFYFGIISSWYFILFSLAVIINIIISIKKIKNFKYYRSFFAVYINAILMLFIAASPDLFLSCAFLSLGELVFAYLLLFRENRQEKIVDITRDFLWQRVCDFFTFMALLLLYLDHGHLLTTKLIRANITQEQFLWPAIFLLCSLIMRAISSSFWPSESKEDGNIKFIAINRSTFALYGSLLILYQCLPIILLHKILSFYLVIFSLFLILAILFHARLGEKLGQRFNLLLVLINIILCYYQLAMWAYIISGTAFSFSLLYLTKPQFYQAKSINLKWIFNIFIYFGKFLGKYVGPFYTDIICFRLPQSLLVIIQIFLRLFHGSNYYMRGFFILLIFIIYFKLRGNIWAI